MISLLTAPSPAAESGWPLKGLPDEARLAWQTLRNAEVFAMGPIGFAGQTSDGELAIRILARYPNAVAIFKLMAAEATPEGKLYALTALHALDGATFKRALEPRPKNTRVSSMAGCLRGKEPVADIIKRIESGTYDQRVPKRK